MNWIIILPLMGAASYMHCMQLAAPDTSKKEQFAEEGRPCPEWPAVMMPSAPASPVLHSILNPSEEEKIVNICLAVTDPNNGHITRYETSGWSKAKVKSCAICLETRTQHPAAEKQVVTQLPCGHKFHSFCLSGVKNGLCPLCRAVIPIDNTHAILPHDIPSSGSTLADLAENMRQIVATQQRMQESQSGGGSWWTGFLAGAGLTGLAALFVYTKVRQE